MSSSMIFRAPVHAKKNTYTICSIDLQTSRSTPPINLAYNFKTCFDPQDLCDSLAMVLSRYPIYGARMGTKSDPAQIEVGVEDATITTVEASAAVVRSPNRWAQLTFQFPLRTCQTGYKVFQALLVRTWNPADGCTLLVSFDQGLADPTTCAAFMCAWSQQHMGMFGVVAQPLNRGLPRDVIFQCTEPEMAMQRFFFYTNKLQGLKARINEEAPEDCQVTTNDILMALVASAVAPQTPPAGHSALIVLNVDPRGWKLPADFMGNGVRPIHLYVEWTALQSEDLAVIAIAVHRAIAAGLKNLCMEGTIMRPQPPLLEWNSWVQAETLLDADFGGALKAFEWVDLRTMQQMRTVNVLPVVKGGGLGMQLTLAHAEMEYFSHIWSTLTADVPPQQQEPPQQLAAEPAYTPERGYLPDGVEPDATLQTQA